MEPRRYPATIVNHAGIEIAVPPEVVWHDIVNMFVGGHGWCEKGYVISPIEDPAAMPGSYRMSMEQDGRIVDDRICRVTERDESARRLSLHADYLSLPEGLQVFVTYQAHEIATGTRYTLDCHSRLNVTAPSDRRDDIVAIVVKMTTQFDNYLAENLGRTKLKLEHAAATAQGVSTLAPCCGGSM